MPKRTWLTDIAERTGIESTHIVLRMMAFVPSKTGLVKASMMKTMPLLSDGVLTSSIAMQRMATKSRVHTALRLRMIDWRRAESVERD